MEVYEVLPSGALTLHLTFFLPLSLSFSILVCAVMVPSVFTFHFSIKKWEYTIWPICQYFILFFFFLFGWSFMLFSQPIILRKVCVLEIFLTQSLIRSHYFFKKTFLLKKLFNAILPCRILSSSLSISLLFPLFFPFHLPYNQTGY